ncbi:SDR family NAD(P)-dependent oxidoreductase [Actinomycetospora sp. TBRC 11914]|uniref:SDR family NAD(P)-dependent oxidoreductase n=1 Tax=Actinomycetospora sp. TBRC 11914 TaxID=2729387 RepID=UPI00145E2B67|nr:SDR family NAD(P)-dependent oxidoreductase [Actinomycetospora sp. TBRC 11914]NMO91923.1 SDR family NAD(P)-dependent oxidoreductase [Actinomycetospora sp. TBRC 11914]
MPDTVLVLGGRSEIGVALARRLVAEGRASTVVLAARRADDLAAEARALADAGSVRVATVEFDADDLASHAALLDTVEREHGAPDTVVVAFGVLGDQQRAEVDAEHALAVVHTDYTAQVGILTRVAARMRARGHGEIVVFSSVAGWRVRRANYVYGSAKAGLDGFASGLADALHGSGVHLTLVRPGFVVGRMTADSGLAPAPLSSTPDEVADAVAAGLARRRDVVWVPAPLRVLAVVMRLLPAAVWRRMPR